MIQLPRKKSFYFLARIKLRKEERVTAIYIFRVREFLSSPVAEILNRPTKYRQLRRLKFHDSSIDDFLFVSQT